MEENRKAQSRRSKRTTFIHRDYLGSIDTVTDIYGKVIESIRYSAFGKRRYLKTLAKNSGIKYGFTSHEEIEELELVHMNGRVYDPTIGRFLRRSILH